MPSARTVARGSAVLAVPAIVATTGLPAWAAPTPSPTPTADRCDGIVGLAGEYCRGDDEPGVGPQRDTEPASFDPLQTLADGIATGAAWIVDQLSAAVQATTTVDFTNRDFVATYAICFAAATFLTVLLWLWGITKRAVRGASLTRALGEAVGLLWVTVLASAFTPLVLYTVVSAVDSITEVLAGGGNSKFFEAFSSALRKDAGEGGGGPVIRIILGLVSILAAGVVWLELVVRASLLYVGAVLGTIVYSGLVDRDLWGRVRKWVGIMIAIIFVKPIIIIVLALASAMAGSEPSTDTTAAIISGLATIIIAIVASALIFRMIPGMGDEIVAARRDSYDPASRQSIAAITRPVSGVRQGIDTHAARDSMTHPGPPPQAPRIPSTSSGMSVHATRADSHHAGGKDGR
ncbi:hypothetical protein [Streptomyces jumonjinensis]|uniref:hypothetical protein n=1 Tax=Streptomyces jumonjinensis TaxID=1945 RepID=UPI003787E70E